MAYPSKYTTGNDSSSWFFQNTLELRNISRSHDSSNFGDSSAAGMILNDADIVSEMIFWVINSSYFRKLNFD